MCLSAFVSVLGSHEIECCNIQDKPQFPHLITILYILPLHQCPKKNDDIGAGRNASLEMRKRDDDEGTMRKPESYNDNWRSHSWVVHSREVNRLVILILGPTS